MDGGDPSHIHIVSDLGRIAKQEWDGLANPAHAPFDPFVSWDFLRALEESGCVGVASGWRPAHIIVRDEGGAALGAMPLYAKDHSYGEYVFDHGWADAVHRAGGTYYPKLQCAAPFTPVPGRRLLARDEQGMVTLAQAAINLARRTHCSSVHVIFASAEACAALSPLGYLTRMGIQYHWFNRGYQRFEEFLADLSSQKRKTIRRERARAREGLSIRRLHGPDIKPADWDFFFRCYVDTGSRKWGSPYLNRDFFALLGERLSERCVLFVAYSDQTPIASALNLLGGDALFGRYWGRLADAATPQIYPLSLHDAVPISQDHSAGAGAGAQGDHKLARGYLPAPTYSAHWIAHPGLRSAVAQFLSAETPAVVQEAEVLAEFSPFKKG